MPAKVRRLLSRAACCINCSRCCCHCPAGEALEAYIFMGPVYYQKLKHMVGGKYYAMLLATRGAWTVAPDTLARGHETRTCHLVGLPM